MNPYKVAKLINEKLSPELKKEIEGIKENSDNWNPDLYDIFEQNDKDLAKSAEKYLDSQSGWTPPQMKVAVIGSKDTMATAKKKIAATLPKKKAKPAAKIKYAVGNVMEGYWSQGDSKKTRAKIHELSPSGDKAIFSIDGEINYTWRDLSKWEIVTSTKASSKPLASKKDYSGTGIAKIVLGYNAVNFSEYERTTDAIKFHTRENGSVSSEKPGSADYDAATQIVRLVLNEYKNVQPEIETVDEWTCIEFKKEKTSSKPATSPITTSPTGRYRGIFGDYDNDGLKNVDDPHPEKAGDKESVEEVKLSDEIAALIEYRNSQEDIRKEFVAMLAKKAKGEEEIASRTKTPFSILNKLRRKRLVTKVKADGNYEEGTQGLTDVIGAMIVFDTQAELEKFKKQAKAGDFGKVVEFNDYYATDHAGYKAYHFGLVYKGAPIELQAKTVRQKKLSNANHELYKTGKGDAKHFKALTDVAEQADAGDTAAANVIDPIISDKTKLNEYMSTKLLAPVALGIAKLTENQTLYFKNGGTKAYKIPLSKIYSVKQNPPKSMITALLLMHKAAKGETGKRVPIQVKKVGDRYEVVDGNATFAAAQYSGWKEIVAEIIDGGHPTKKAHSNRKPEAKEKFAKDGAKGYLASEVAKAKRGDYIGLSTEQILAKAQAFEKARSKAAISRDEKGDSKKRLSPTPENLVRWMNNPGGFDLVGVDTYKKGDHTANLKIKKEIWWNRLGIKL